MSPVGKESIDQMYERLLLEAKESGYNINPDVSFTKDLVRGLLENIDRYSYQACPCRLASGERKLDLDIICPCDYRDPDLNEFGACYCALYVSDEIARGEKQPESIPERRTPERGTHEEEYELVKMKELPFPVWRCKVCGYLCARPEPPLKCPICKVSKDRFERFM